jgi:sterol desaturase/sphingolipid hydroxylase (fatty acid hydroxylase superfamily)
MHGVHHSVDRAERDSIFSSGLALWDTLHGTARGDSDAVNVIIGLPQDGRSHKETFLRTLVRPFVHTRGNK